MDYICLFTLQEMQKRGEKKELMLAYMKAYQGRFREAALLFQNSGYEQKTLEMFTDLRMFDQAEELLSTASGETQKALMRRRADWARDSNEPRVAAEMFVASGDYDKAIKLMIENDWIDMLVNLMYRMDRSDVESLRTIGAYLVRKGEYTLASQLFLSINDMRALINMHVNASHWTDAFAIASRYPKYNEEVYLPYARWLAENDRFEEAQKAYHMAGHDVEALWVLEQLTENAVREDRFLDAGYYHWMLSSQYLDRCASNPQLIEKMRECSVKADCYYAYDAIHKYLAEPFTSRPAEALVNIARYLAFQDEVHKVSRVAIMYTLAKQGRALGAYKLARYALEQLSYLKAPARFEKLIGIATVMIRAKPFTDAEELLPMCYRCGVANPLTGGNSCIHCKTPFVFSFVSFEVLPLVEFEVADDIPTDEARQLIEAEPPLSTTDKPFQKQLQKKNTAIVADRQALLNLEKNQAIIADWPKPLKTRFYYNVIPEISITICSSCFRVT
ncbi:unnamed protein product [Toxocara canis]|uniref:Intraflagellar transport protein 122 homolog n=1 Tax=Toxocara canis TaxID=6265 RepID=A0A183TW31_TOXCA|nr:unnamed protein product [Toxocara canis]